MREFSFGKAAFWIVSPILFSASDAWVPGVRRAVHRAPQAYLKAAVLDRVSSDIVCTDSGAHQNWWEKENFRSYNLASHSTKNNLWHGLVPLLPQSKGLDVALEFVDAHDGAVRMAEACFTTRTDSEIVSFLEEGFQHFQQLVQEMCPTLPEVRCKARIVATRGSSGTKCPRWHLDHVPVRWIQSLVGPGCEYVVGNEGVNRSALNNLDWTNIAVRDVNSRMVSPVKADIRQGREGEAIILVGNGWNDDRKGVDACIHKSPDLHPLEGRVLLTLDVVMPESF